MNLRIESPSALFNDDTGELLGPVLDSIPNRKLSISDVQRAFEAYDATLRASIAEGAAKLQVAEKAAADSRAFAEGILKRAGDILADDQLDEGERIGLLKELHTFAATPVREREIVAAQTQIAALEAKIAGLQT